MKAIANTSNVYQMVTDRIVEMMKSGIIPWRKPWHGAKGDSTEGMAINYVTRRAYSTINQWLLGEPGEYLSYKQVTDLGGKVKKGAKSRIVVFYTKVEFKKKNEETGEEELCSYPLLRYYNVFHLSQVEGIETKIGTDAPVNACPEIDADADAVIFGYLMRETSLKFRYNKPSDRAYYSRSTDEVVVPMLEQYDNAAEYYSTTFHELTHSTMLESRCNRMDDTKSSFFGNESYSREELVAEMGSAMLCSATGVDTQKSLKNSAAYIQGWLKALKNDNKMIVWAAARAEKAANYILGIN